MKIEQFNSIAQTSGAPAARKTEATVSFSSYLDQALSGPAGAATAPLMPPPAAALPPLVTGSPLSETHRQGVNQGQSLLACLEEYQTVLGDERRTLKDAGASLEKLENELRQMAPLLDRLDSQDPLSQVLQSISGLAVAESVKFRRGDYV